MKLLSIVLFALAGVIATPAHASHGNPKDFYSVQKQAKKTADATPTGGIETEMHRQGVQAPLTFAGFETIGRRVRGRDEMPESRASVVAN